MFKRNIFSFKSDKDLKAKLKNGTCVLDILREGGEDGIVTPFLDVEGRRLMSKS